MKRLLPLILLVAVSLCGSNRLKCQIFNPSEKSLQQYCDGFKRMPPGNCSSDLNLTIDPSQVNQLRIGGCDPNVVLDSTKHFQRNLRSLDISHSAYKSLDWFNLTIDQLEIFNASNNELSDLPLNFFLKFPEIIEIDLSHNNLSSYLECFNSLKLSKVQKLHLSHNKFAVLIDIIDIPLQSIEYIDLSSNQIENLRYVPYKSLKELHLEGNPLNTFRGTLLEGLFHERLTALFLTWKDVEIFECHGMDERHGERMRIVQINDTSGEGIFRTPNGAYEIRCRDKCFENVYYFEAVHSMFQNGNDVIQNIGPRLSELDLSGNFIGELSVNAFGRFARLERLELGATNLTWFDFNMLWMQEKEISKLNISNNNIKELRNVPSLRRQRIKNLIIGGNRIENVYKITEHLNPSIEYLDLSAGNNMGKLNDTTFQRLVELEQLNLSNTNLVLPNSNPFEMLRKLEVLDLSHNNLGNFNFSTLSATLHNLTELHLAGCRIKDMTVLVTVIQYLGPNLTSLDLSSNAAHGPNDLSNFDLNLLKHLRKLRHLDISYNELKTVDFKSLPHDEYIHINLEGNNLIELTNLQKRISNWQWAKLELAYNRLPCNYVKQLKIDYTQQIFLAGESWQQKPDRDCRTSTESIKSFLSNVYDTIKFW